MHNILHPTGCLKLAKLFFNRSGLQSQISVKNMIPLFTWVQNLLKKFTIENSRSKVRTMNRLSVLFWNYTWWITLITHTVCKNKFINSLYLRNLVVLHRQLHIKVLKYGAGRTIVRSAEFGPRSRNQVYSRLSLCMLSSFTSARYVTIRYDRSGPL